MYTELFNGASKVKNIKMLDANVFLYVFYCIYN